MMEPVSVWEKIAAPIPPDMIQWRQDGKAVARGSKFVARFVAYIDAQFVRERLDAVVPGLWDLSLDMLPVAEGGEAEDRYAFKARLTIQGVSREDVGSGRDYKNASSDAFKRAAVRFGIAHELYAYDQNWVQVDGDGKYAKPVEDPAEVYAKRGNTSAPPRAQRASQSAPKAMGVPVMPFGETKGQPLGGHTTPALQKVLKWVRDPLNPDRAVKFKDLDRDISAILNDRTLGLDDDGVVEHAVKAEEKFTGSLPF